MPQQVHSQTLTSGGQDTNIYSIIFVSPALAGKTDRDHFVPCCCCCLLLWKQVNIWHLPSICFDGFQPELGHRCNMRTLICWWGQRSHIKVKGHLRSSCKIGWKCENGLIWKVAKSDWNQTWFIDIICEPSYVHAIKGHTKVKGHLRQVVR